MSVKPVFDPRILCYFHYTDTWAARTLKDAVPDGDVEIYSSRGEALFNLDADSSGLTGTYYAAIANSDERVEHDQLPEAYIFDLRTSGPKAYDGMSMAEEAIGTGLSNGNEDMQSVATAIELLATHQQLAEDGAPKPYVFLKASEDSKRIARLIADHTGLDVQLFKKEVSFKADPEKPHSWPRKPEEMTSFTPLLKQTDTVSPSPKAKTIELAYAAA